MFTQCPECEVAFRVTADVLRQAAGKVRCGGCGIAFNALAHLSEEMPDVPDARETNEQSEPAPVDPPSELEAGSPPQAISAEQSVALLKTLDQLAGEDVRIEDTGVEWRVIDSDEDDIDDELADDPVPSAVHEEMRFDDNTPLPDDFDLDAPSVLPPTAVIEEPEPEPEAEVDDSQIDLVFGEPDEWEDLLGDIGEVGEVPLDMDAQFALQAEELGLDLSGEVQALEEPEAEPESEPEPELEPEPEPEADLRETSIEEDLIAAAFEIEAAAREQAQDEIDLDDVQPEDLSRAGILDEDDYLEAITEEDEAEILDEIELEESLEDQELANAVLDDVSHDDEVAEEIEADDLVDAEEIEEADVFEEAVEYAEPIDVEVPEPTEEEKTVNMMIDQELLAIAVEDDDGFTSTIVQKQVSSEDDIPSNDDVEEPEELEEQEVPEASEAPAMMMPTEGSPLMETIIMEGETVLNQEDEERLAAARAAASESLKKAGFNEEQSSFRDWRPPKYSMGAAAALLLVLLIFQVIHHSREALAVSPAFQNTIAPVYRMVGTPITPAWDVKGWRFEATKGSTNEEGDVLTIYSRIGNNSEQTLPYPLVHVSLTDRFEEIIGSRVLEPSDYLLDDADPNMAIPPKTSFDAVISINSPSAAATSFKLNVCYRLDSGELRCADKDFR